ncbi:MAG TPA: HAD family hydrolase [Candidatus Saccharimonadales bacterium]|nr:HAD family hydrolase [Candidatus Saccharimonadales bacterium]
MSTPPTTLVFDLDGTLLDVSARHHTVYTTICASFDANALDRATYWRLKRLRAGWPQILAASGIAPDRFDAFEAEFNAQIELPENLGFDVLFPAALPLLTKVAAHHICVLVAMRASAPTLRAELGVLSLRPFFEATETAASLGEPAFKVRAGLIRKMVPAGTPAIVIGDTEADVMAASALGYPSIAVCSGFREREILEQQEPTYLVDDLGGVEGALRRAGVL